MSGAANPARRALLWALLAGLLMNGAIFPLLDRFTVPLLDRTQYLAPVATAQHPLDLQFPMVGDFEQFDRCWGLQWFGVLVLNKLCLWGWPWSHVLHTAFAQLQLSLVAAVLGWLVWRTTRKVWAPATAAVLYLGNIYAMNIVSWGRPEVWGSLFTLVLVASLSCGLAGHASKWKILLLGMLAAFWLPLLHPLALGIGGGLLAVAALAQWKLRSPSSAILWVSGAYVAGVASFVGYLAAVPMAWQHFKHNLALQETFLFGRWSFLYHPQQPLYSEYIWWMLALVMIARLGLRLRAPSAKSAEEEEWSLRLAGASVTVVLLYGFVTKVINPCHTGLALPAVLFLAMTAVTELARRSRWPKVWLAGLAILIAWYLAVIPVRWWRWRQSGWIDVPARWEAALRPFRHVRQVLIPCHLWEAALAVPGPNYRFHFFPVAYPDELRRQYEFRVMAETQTGDILIVDLLDRRSAGIHAAPLTPVEPPPADRWEFVGVNEQLLPAATPWGWQFQIYRRR